MNFMPHFELQNKHAFLSASQNSWLRYSEDKLREYYITSKAKERGTRLHALAAELISLGQKLPRTSQAFNLYVNDAIGYRMQPEQPLKYSDNCFGTADTISFTKNVLRIHDYKSGKTPVTFDQLRIYAALFCLEYRVEPHSISRIELRIYQQDGQPFIEETDPDVILDIMNIIKKYDQIIESMKGGVTNV